MLTIKEWMELVDHRITEGSEYGWQCFGTDAYSLSSWNGDQDGWSFNIVFDTKTQAVYQVEVCDYARDRAYRMTNAEFKTAHDREAQHRGENARQAWDDVNYIDLDVDDDFVQKALAIKADEDYDTRVDVPLNLPDDVLFELMKRAHEQDITLNKMVEEILWVAIHAEEDREVLDSQYPGGDGYWRDDADWDEIAEDHGEDDGDEIESDLQDLRPAAKMKSVKKKHKKNQ